MEVRSRESVPQSVFSNLSGWRLVLVELDLFGNKENLSSDIQVWIASCAFSPPGLTFFSFLGFIDSKLLRLLSLDQYLL